MLTEAYQTTHYTGHNFSPGETCFLSLWLGPQSAQYAVSTNDYNQVFELGHLEFTQQTQTSWEDRLSFLLQNFSLKQRKFEKVMVAILNPDFAILPQAYASDQDTKEYLRFATGKNTIKHSFSHKLHDFRFSYTLEPELLRSLENTFNGVFIRHAGAVNLNLFFSHRSFSTCNAALFVNEKMVEIAIRENERLLFYNVYNVAGIEDVLYYVLFAAEQFQLDLSQMRMALAAQEPMDGTLVKSLRKYVKHLVPVVTGEPVKTHKEIANLPKHYYFTLLNQHLCEL